MSKNLNKFKVGDVVRRISNSHCEMVVGPTWIVKKVDNRDDSLVDGLGEEWWSQEDFELVNKDDILKQISMSGDGGVVCEVVDKQLYSPLTVQQAGDHYKKRGIQPIEYGLANNLSFPQVNVVKYITRHEDKNGLDDLAKSIHYHFFEALRVYGEEGTHELRNKVLSLLGIEQGVFK